MNQSNTPVWRWDNVHAFGANLLDEDPDDNTQLFEYNIRFPGQYFDRETSLHYNYFRYYTVRYISPDPTGLDVTVKFYPGVSGFWHIGIGVNTFNTKGFYPVSGASNSRVINGCRFRV